MTQTTWDPSFTNGFTLSNSNLTASRASSGSPSTAWLFSTGSLAVGLRWVYELAVTGAVTGSGLGLGVGTRDASNDDPQNATYIMYTGAVFNNGAVVADPAQQSTLANATTFWPDTTYVTVAVDLVANQVTFAYQTPTGRWSYSAFSLASMILVLGSSLITPFVIQSNVAGTPTVTLNDGTTPFQNATFVASLGAGWQTMSGSVINPLVTTAVSWDINHSDDWQLASGNLVATAPDGQQTTAGDANVLYGLPAVPDGLASYFEVTLNNVTTAFTLGVGIGARGADVTDVTTTGAGQAADPAYSTFVAFYPTGVVTNNGTWVLDPQNAGTLGPANVPNVWGGGPVTIGVLVDLVNDQVSFYNGGAADQITGPVSIKGIGDQVTYPIVYTDATASPLPVASINGGSQPFALGLPQGAVPLFQAVVGYGRSTGLASILLAVTPNPPTQGSAFQLIGQGLGGPFSNVNNVAASVTLQAAPTAFFIPEQPEYVVLSGLETIATVYGLTGGMTAPTIAYLADIGNDVTSNGAPFNVIPPGLPPSPPVVPLPPPPGLPPIPPVVSDLFQSTVISFSDGSASVISTNPLGTTASVSISADLPTGPLTSMSLALNPPNPVQGQPFSVTATANGGLFGSSFLISDVLVNTATTLVTPASAGYTTSLSADNLTLVIGNIINNVAQPHTVLIQDVTNKITSQGITYAVTASS